MNCSKFFIEKYFVRGYNNKHMEATWFFLPCLLFLFNQMKNNLKWTIS